jgi:hypothetical protein
MGETRGFGLEGGGIELHRLSLPQFPLRLIRAKSVGAAPARGFFLQTKREVMHIEPIRRNIREYLRGSRGPL